MKKLILVAMLGVAGLASANSTTENLEIKSSNEFVKEVKVQGGWCEIRIYRNNILVDYSFTYESSWSACQAKGEAMMNSVMLAQ